MVAEWVTAGVAFGVKAFFAVFIFGVLALAVLAIVAIIGNLMKGEPEDEKPDIRPWGKR